MAALYVISTHSSWLKTCMFSTLKLKPFHRPLGGTPKCVGPTVARDKFMVNLNSLANPVQVPTLAERCKETPDYSELSQDSWVTAIRGTRRQESLPIVVYFLCWEENTGEEKRSGWENAYGEALGISAIVESILRSDWGNRLQCRLLHCTVWISSGSKNSHADQDPRKSRIITVSSLQGKTGQQPELNEAVAVQGPLDPETAAKWELLWCSCINCPTTRMLKKS